MTPLARLVLVLSHSALPWLGASVWVWSHSTLSYLALGVYFVLSLTGWGLVRHAHRSLEVEPRRVLTVRYPSLTLDNLAFTGCILGIGVLLTAPLAVVSQLTAAAFLIGLSACITLVAWHAPQVAPLSILTLLGYQWYRALLEDRTWVTILANKNLLPGILQIQVMHKGLWLLSSETLVEGHQT